MLLSPVLCSETGSLLGAICPVLAKPLHCLVIPGEPFLSSIVKMCIC